MLDLNCSGTYANSIGVKGLYSLQELELNLLVVGRVLEIEMLAPETTQIYKIGQGSVETNSWSLSATVYPWDQAKWLLCTSGH